MEFICLFLPSIIALQIDLKINKIKEYNYLAILMKYFIYCYFITFFNNLFIWLISSEKFFYYDKSIFTYDFCLKYMGLSIVLSILIPIIFKILKENISLTIEVKGKKNDKKSNK